MAREQPSLQDLIRSRQQSGFVGRQVQVVQYQENLGFSVDDERRRFLFNIHGDAGVGKTYLTKQLRQIAIDGGALAAYTDESIDDVTSAMTAIAEELDRGGARLRDFEKRAAAYRDRRHELESDPNAPDGVAAFLTKTVITIGLQAARNVPVAGSLLAPVDSATVADQANLARLYIARKFRDHAVVRLLLSPSDELTPIFVAELNRIAAGRPLALFFDAYERTAALLDQWLRDLYAGRYGDLPGTLITTISGQDPLNPNLWGEYLPVIADVPLEPFSEAEARQFLASKHITDEATLQVILTLSGRLPMWLATLAEVRPADAADIGDPAGDAVERFLKWEEDPARRNIAVSAALPRMLNQDVLAAITAPDHAAGELFSWLCGLPFVSRQAGSWRYHDVVRAAMLRLQRAQAPSEWRAKQTVLAQAHARWATDTVGGRTDSNWANPGWIDHTCEETYHLLCADPVNNLPQALASAVKAAEHSLVRARQWAGLLADAGRDTDNHLLREWGQRLLDGIHDSDLTQYLTYLITDAHLNQATLTVALEERGDGHRLADRYDDALADFSRAIELDPKRIWAIAHRGATYREMKRYDDALADLNRAIELDPKRIWAIADRGATYREMERYADALADFSRAIELDPTADWAFAARGATYRLVERYDDALADFSRAIELDPSAGWAFADRGETYRLVERYDDALADFSRAIELDPSDAWAIGSRGQTYHEMERYDDALADLSRAIELGPKRIWAIAGRGATYREMERYDDALADFSRAIELDPTAGWAFVGRGATYRLVERYDDALADFSRAIELDPSLSETLGMYLTKSREHGGPERPTTA
jgi:tetratricopeptide (TPR) repeat protein